MFETNPYMRRYLLALRLRELREKAGLTQEQAARLLGFSKSKLTRIELAEHGISRNDLAGALAVYRVPLNDPIQVELHALQGTARQHGWWEKYRPIDPRFVAVEAEASRIDSYASTVIPGLLQTRTYSLELLRVARPDLDQEQLERQVQLRQERQRRILGDRKVCIVLDECALRRRYGDTCTMVAAYRRILDCSQLHNVTVQVLPFSATNPPPVMGSLTLLTVPLGDLAATFAHVESAGGDLFLSDGNDVGILAGIHTQLRAAALDPEESRALIASRLEELGHGTE